jgi:hypothetical protein
MAKKPTQEEPKPRAQNAEAVTVKVAVAALHEAGTTYMHGETFQTTAERASALGRLVTPVLAD